MPTAALPPKQPAPQWPTDMDSGGWPVAGLPEPWQSVLPPHGVAAPDHAVVRLPAVADLFSYLLLDTGECVFTNVAYSRGLVLYAEEYGVPVLDVLLLYSL
jgi:hypothetical protein